MKKLSMLLLIVSLPVACCQYPEPNGTSEPSVTDQGSQFAPETASMTQNTPSGSYDNGGISETSSGDSSGGSSSCWSAYDN